MRQDVVMIVQNKHQNSLQIGRLWNAYHKNGLNVDQRSICQWTFRQRLDQISHLRSLYFCVAEPRITTKLVLDIVDVPFFSYKRPYYTSFQLPYQWCLPTLSYSIQIYSCSIFLQGEKNLDQHFFIHILSLPENLIIFKHLFAIKFSLQDTPARYHFLQAVASLSQAAVSTKLLQHNSTGNCYHYLGNQLLMILWLEPSVVFITANS